MFDKKYDAEDLASVYKSVYEKKLDPVGQEDKDIDNDGDHDKSDKYLLNRRKVRGAAIKTRKEEVELDENRRAARSAGGYKDDSKKQTDPSKDGFTGISGSIKDIMRQNREIEAREKKKTKKEEVEVVDENLQKAVDNLTKKAQGGLERMGVKINRTSRGTARPSAQTANTIRQNKATNEDFEIEEGMKQARANVGAGKCWDGYTAKGTKKKNGKEVPNCVKEEDLSEGERAGLGGNRGLAQGGWRTAARGDETSQIQKKQDAQRDKENAAGARGPEFTKSAQMANLKRTMPTNMRNSYEPEGEMVEEGKKELSREKRNKMFRRAGNLSREALQGGDKGSEAHKKSGKIVKALNKDAEENDRNDVKEETLRDIYEAKKKGLWDNIHAKRERGESPAKPGDEGYPKTLKVESLEEAAPALVGVLAKMAAKKAAVHVAKKSAEKVKDKMGKLLKGDEEEEEG